MAMLNGAARERPKGQIPFASGRKLESHWRSVLCAHHLLFKNSNRTLSSLQLCSLNAWIQLLGCIGSFWSDPSYRESTASPNLGVLDLMEALSAKPCEWSLRKESAPWSFPVPSYQVEGWSIIVWGYIKLSTRAKLKQGEQGKSTLSHIIQVALRPMSEDAEMTLAMTAHPKCDPLPIQFASTTPESLCLKERKMSSRIVMIRLNMCWLGSRLML